jgi:hypothetical protein
MTRFTTKGGQAPSNSTVKDGAPTRTWLRLQEVTPSINPTKQGYYLI